MKKIRLTGDARRLLRALLETDAPSLELQEAVAALPVVQQRELAHRIVRDARQRLRDGDAQLSEYRAIRAETAASLRLLDALTRTNGVNAERRAELAAQTEKLTATLRDLDEALSALAARRQRLLASIAELESWRRAATG